MTAAHEAAARVATPPRIAMVAWMVAGVETQYQHLSAELAGMNVRILPVETVPYRRGGWLERIPLPSKPRGQVRSALTLLPLIWNRDLDAVWTQMSVPLLPFVLTRGRITRTPVFFAVDTTPARYATMRRYYGGTDPHTAKGRVSAILHRAFYHRCAGLLPWSRWVADSMIEDYGVPPERVHVVHPGVDVARWHPAPRRSAGRTQLLFVGGDFERKGGPLLLDVYRRHFRDRCDLHLVTRGRVVPEPGVRVYENLGPRDPELLALYQRCDVFVLPTRADCFSMAAIEAMACGLPVVISAVGGIPEIVVDGETGDLLPADDDGSELRRALDALVTDARRRELMGAAGRDRAVRRFETRTQANAVLALIRQALSP